VRGGVLELKIDYGPGYRIYFGKDGERLVILFGGGTKKRQSADIEAARRSLAGVQRPQEGGALVMALTRDFKETIKARAETDAAFRSALLTEALECFLSSDAETGKAVLRDYINATIGFETLGEETGRPPKSLMRMLGPRGNPQARNLFDVIAHLQKREGVRVEVRLAR